MPGRKPKVLTTVQRALESNPGQEWQREIALALAAEMDLKANASIAGQLRTIMEEIGATAAGTQKDVSDDLAAKRAARRSAAG